MASTAELLSLALMAVFGIGTAGVIVFAMRDIVYRVAEGPAPEATRVASAGGVVYLAGFLLTLGGVLFDVGGVAGVGLSTLGIAVIALAVVPMAVGLYMAYDPE
jgi:hypothetical protein